jgi:hypothetical protein
MESQKCLSWQLDAMLNAWSNPYFAVTRVRFMAWLTYGCAQQSRELNYALLKAFSVRASLKASEEGVNSN